MGLQSVEVTKGGDIIIDFGDGPIVVTNTEMMAAKQTKLGARDLFAAKRAKGALPVQVFIRENNDGTFTVATGPEPTAWPVDESKKR